jgi:hypothetical protein
MKVITTLKSCPSQADRPSACNPISEHKAVQGSDGPVRSALLVFDGHSHIKQA